MILIQIFERKTWTLFNRFGLWLQEIGLNRSLVVFRHDFGPPKISVIIESGDTSTSR